MEYKKPTAEMIEEFKKMMPGRVRAGEDISSDYAHDEMSFYADHMPDLVVDVISTEEISKICKLCYENDVPFVPRGAGTGLSAGCVAIAGGVVINMSKMNKILGYDLDNFIIRVQAGAFIGDMQEDCAKNDMLYPPDPGEKLSTVGGNVATNAGGMRACKYGTTRDYVRAMTVVMPDGGIMRFGGEVSKNCSGYSMINLMCGSEGTLGIITELSMKIIPAPKTTVSLLATFLNLDNAISCVPKIKKANLNPQALEFLTRENVVSIEAYLGKTFYPGVSAGEPVGAYLIVTFDGNDQDELDRILGAAGEVFTDNGALDVLIYDTADGLRQLWEIRANCLEAILADFKLTDECDVVVPIPQVANLVNYASSLMEEIGLIARFAGHAGDGNVHMNVCSNDLEKEEFLRRSHQFMDKVTAKGLELGGMVSGEHGIGAARIGYLEQNLGKEQLQLMKAIKMACDPKLLLNPGKVCYSL